MTKIVTDDTLSEFLGSDEVTVIDFWAPWCGPCKTVGPIVESLALDYAGRLTVGKLDIDENNGATVKYGIRNIPTIIVFKNGEIVLKHVGMASKAVLDEKIKTVLG